MAGTPTRSATQVQANDMRVFRKTSDNAYHRLPGLSGVGIADNQAPKTQLKGLDESTVLIGRAEIADITIDLGNIQFGHEDIRQLLLRKGKAANQFVRVETRGEIIRAVGVAKAAVNVGGVVTFSGDEIPYSILRNIGAGAELRIGNKSLIVRANKSTDQFKTNAMMTVSDPAREANKDSDIKVVDPLNANANDVDSPAVEAAVFSLHVPIYRWDDLLVGVSGGDGFSGQVDQGLSGQMVLTPTSPTGLPNVASTQTEPYAD